MKNLFTTIDNHIKRDVYPFHMPGHKQNYNFFNNKEINDVLKFDLTEIQGLDNLNEPKDVLLNLNNRISKIFGSYKSFLTTNGSTTGVISSILCSCNEDDFVLAGRNSHKSLFSGITFAKCNVEYIYPTLLNNNIIGGISPTDVENAILKNDKIKAVFITSPTYEGIVSDIKKISTITKKYNKLLIVDEAHGAHFNLNNYFPVSAISKGADIVIQSLHKTLPSLTQTAVVHINKSASRYNIEKFIYMLQSSSPSYIFMYTVDKLIYDIENRNLNFNEYILNLEKFRLDFNKKVGINKKIQLLETKDFEYDKSRLTFIINGNKTGKDIDNILNYEFNIQIESSSINHIIAISTICDTVYGFNLLLKSLIEIDNKLTYCKYDNINLYSLQEQKYKLCDFNKYNSTWVNIDDSENFVTAESIIPYPPGIPLLLPCEVIKKDNIKILNELISKNINIIGGIDLINNKIKVIKEI